MFRKREREKEMDRIGLNRQFRKMRVKGVDGCEGGTLTIGYRLSRRVRPSLREGQRQKQKQRQRLLRRLQERRQGESVEDQKREIQMGSSVGCFICARLPRPLRCLSGSTDDHQQQQKQRSHNSIPPCFIHYNSGHRGYETVSCFSPFEQGRSYCTLGISKEIPWSQRIIPSLSGTCHPWILALISMGDLIAISLLNPVSGHEIALPGSPISWSDYNEAPGLVLSMSPHSPTPCYTVLIILNYYKPKLLFFRKEDRVWSRVNLPWHLRSFNTFRGDLYALRASEGAMHLLAVYTSHPIPCIMEFAMDTSQLPLPETRHFFHRHLVESPNGEELLLVLENVKLRDQRDVSCFQTVGFHVFKADLSRKMWIRKETLGDRVLIVTDSQTLFLSAASVGHGVKGNCIYFPTRSATGQTPLMMFDLDSEMVTDSPFSIPSKAGLFMFVPSM